MRIIVALAEQFDDYPLFERSMVKLTSQLSEVELVVLERHPFVTRWAEKNDVVVLIQRWRMDEEERVQRYVTINDMVQSKDIGAMIVFGKDQWTRHVLIMGRFAGIKREREIAYYDVKVF